MQRHTESTVGSAVFHEKIACWFFVLPLSFGNAVLPRFPVVQQIRQEF